MTDAPVLVTASATSAAGVNAIAVQHLTHPWRYLRTRPQQYQSQYHTSDAFERFTGQTPQSLSEFFRADRELFADALRAQYEAGTE